MTPMEHTRRQLHDLNQVLASATAGEVNVCMTVPRFVVLTRPETPWVEEHGLLQFLVTPATTRCLPHKIEGVNQCPIARSWRCHTTDENSGVI